MGFKMKGINNITNNTSPLLNTDPDDEKVVNTEFVQDLAGNDFATARTITTDPTRAVESQATSDQAFLDSFAPEYNKAQAEGFGGTITDYITQKEETLGFKGSEVKQTRDYDVEKIPEYLIASEDNANEFNRGKSYKLVDKVNSWGGTFQAREYYYPSYNTGHHEKGTLVNKNEMLGNLYEKYEGNVRVAQNIYEDWVLRNTGKKVNWGGSYSRDAKSGGGSESENKGNWQNEN